MARAKRTPTLLEAAAPLIILALLLGIGSGFFNLRIEILLLASAALTGLLAWRLGYRSQEIEQGITASIAKGLPATYIMVLVGWMIGTWIAAGTVPMLIYYGLHLISPQYFLVTACLVCAVVSLLTGTSYGTAGTVGIVFMGIAESLGIPAAQAGGAVIAGAYFGDKISPFSDTTILAPMAAGSNIYDHIRHMMWTTVPAFTIGLIIYYFLGLNSPSAAEPAQVAQIMRTMKSQFHFSPLLLLPPALILYFIVAKKPVVPGMIVAAAAAMILAVVYQEVSWVDTFNYGVKGYTAHTGAADVDKLLSKGGMVPMMQPVLIALCAFAFGGIVQKAGMLDVLLHQLAKFARTTARLIATTVASVLAIGFLTGSSYLSLLIPGELFAPVFKKMNLAAKNLSRTLEDCGTVVVPLLPWSVAGVFMAGTLGVSPAAYGKFAFMNYLGILFALLYGITGIGIAPKIREDETQTGS